MSTVARATTTTITAVLPESFAGGTAATVVDSGAAVPGFGGVLDILDAIILAAPVAFLLALVL